MFRLYCASLITNNNYMVFVLMQNIILMFEDTPQNAYASTTLQYHGGGGLSQTQQACTRKRTENCHVKNFVQIANLEIDPLTILALPFYMQNRVVHSILTVGLKTFCGLYFYANMPDFPSKIEPQFFFAMEVIDHVELLCVHFISTRKTSSYIYIFF